jgi:hypothetical protein
MERFRNDEIIAKNPRTVQKRYTFNVSHEKSMALIATDRNLYS